MTLNYTGVEVDLDNQTVFKVGNFLIQKKSDSTLSIYFIPKDIEKIENIEKMLSYNFTNALPSYVACNPNGYMVDGGGAGKGTTIKASPGGGGVRAANFAFGNNGKSYKLLNINPNNHDGDRVFIPDDPIGGK